MVEALAKLPAEVDVLVVGAGPAGMAAAAALAGSRLSLLWIDQRPTCGGAIHRQPAMAEGSGEGRSFAAPSARAQWRRLSAAVAASGAQLRGRHHFLGLDSDGIALIEDRAAARVHGLKPRAILLAVGAVERVLPRRGGQLPGVRTAGGMQVMLKETGEAPKGRIVIAGNGPLTVALAAQLVAAGNPPLAVIEAGDPLRAGSGAGMGALALLRRPRVLAEAGRYLAALHRAGVPWLRGHRVTDIRQAGEALAIDFIDASGRAGAFEADHLALHDGIRPNRFGLPEAGQTPLVVHAGDCREALGAAAAEADGTAAARRIAGILGGGLCGGLCGGRGIVDDAAIRRERAVQAALARMFAPAGSALLADLPDDTVLCRCEGRTVGDLRALLAQDGGLSPREIKLNGRFAMGACQGRFCGDNVMAVLAALAGGAAPAPTEPLPDESLAAESLPTESLAVELLTGRRWPVRPVAIAALIADQRDPDTK